MVPLANSATLSDIVLNLSDEKKNLVFFSSGSEESLSWAQLSEKALAKAANLQALGVCPQDKVGIIGVTSVEMITTLMAIWLTGAVTVILALPLRVRSLNDLIDSLAIKIKTADIKLVLLQDELESFIQEDVFAYKKFSELSNKDASHFEQVGIDENDLAIIQFTSGSTAEPKGVMIPHKNVINHIDSIVKSANFDPDSDIVASWLPLYHDMGLIGLFLVPMATGAALIMESPQDFLKAPDSWPYLMSKYKATATAGPNFSYALLSRVLKNSTEYDLSHLRIALNGAEPVNPDSVEAFLLASRGSKVNPKSVFPAFGMAEATLAVTFPEPGTGLVTDSVDLDILEHQRFAQKQTLNSKRVRRFAKLGHPIYGFEIKIVDVDTRSEVDERHVGELLIKGTSVTPGYYNNPKATSMLFEDGWLRSGDLGYIADNELVICGRIKDVIIVGGRNIYPEDIEWAVSKITGVRAGNVVAFGDMDSRGKERVVVVAEINSDGINSEHPKLKDSIVSTVIETTGVPVKDVVLLPPGSLPKTSSGKLQRSLCKNLYKTNSFGTLS